MTQTPYDVEKVREAFPALKELTYLNVGTYGLMPEPALQSLFAAITEFEHYGIAMRVNVHSEPEKTRKQLAALMGAEPEEIAFTRNATDGNNLALSGIDWKPGDEIITSDEEHPAIHHPLLYLQQQKGIVVRLVKVSPDADVMRQRLNEVVSPRTRMLAISHVSSESGTRLPVRAMQLWAEEHHVLTLFDGAQALGDIPVNVHEIGCDFYASNGHKWLSGPKGTGVFYVRKDRLETLCMPMVGAGSLEKGDIKTGECVPANAASRFEFGTRAWPLYMGLGASLDWFDSLGWENVRTHMIGLTEYLKEGILARPYLHLISPRKWDESSALTVFSVDGKTLHEVMVALNERHIVVRPVGIYQAVRIAAAHFVNRADMDRLLAALDEITR
jgi:selenocysteine lyase/cysteine desulfurase